MSNIDITSIQLSIIWLSIIISYMILIVIRAILWGDSLNERY